MKRLIEFIEGLTVEAVQLAFTLSSIFTLVVCLVWLEDWAVELLITNICLFITGFLASFYLIKRFL